MKAVVWAVRPTDSPVIFAVDLVVDGKERSFRVEVLTPGLHGIMPLDGEFSTMFVHSRLPRKIAGLVFDYYKGVALRLPMELADD